MPELYRKDIHYGTLSELFDGSGSVAAFGATLTRQIKTTLESSGPRRSGLLRRSWVNAGTRKAGPYAATGRVNNTAPYAGWVANGTAEYFGKMMRIPKRPQDYSRNDRRASGRERAKQLGAFPGYTPEGPRNSFNRDFIFTRHRRGQRANPWVDEAVDSILAKNRLY